MYDDNERMDYKYIEQLLERYWECQTTLEEEAILRSFFAQADIPASLLPYRDLFLAEEAMSHEHLSDDFDQRLSALLQVTAQEEVDSTASHNIVPITWVQRLRPLYRAAAMVAVILTIGMAAQQGFQRAEDEEPETQLSTLAAQQDTMQLFTDIVEAPELKEAVLTTDSLHLMAP